jgi:hypothetical protein
MAFGQITVTSRPIKFAILVDPSDLDALLQGIQINTFLWGGTYNPIIPVFQETPDNWSFTRIKPITPEEIVSGYIRFFDPDILVVCGKIDPRTMPSAGRTVISAGDITQSVTTRGFPSYGIGLHEILAEIGRQEFKFVRRDNLKVLVPTFDGVTEPFLAAAFGDIPPEATGEIYEHCLKQVDAHRPIVSMENFLDFSSGEYLFRRQVCSFKIDVRRYRTDRNAVIFFFDHGNALDVIDYWNLRAVGWDVAPIPKVISASDKAKEVSRKFISDNEGRDPEAPNFERRVSIVKGRSLTEAEHRAFVDSLRQNPTQIMTCQFWYPSMWDEFTHARGHLTCSQLVADTRTTQIGDETQALRIATLAPTFMEVGYRSGPSYANDIDIDRYGLTEFGTEVIPPDQATVARLFGLGLTEEWRVGSNGLTFLGRHADSTTYLNLPNPSAVVASVLETKGWTNFKTSTAGHVAYQMMRHLSGPSGIALVKSRQLIEYLEKLSRTGGYDVAQAYFAEMKKIDDTRPMHGRVHRRVQLYTDAKIFTLGIEVQCAVCTQRSWHALDSADYEVQCPKCLSRFKLPLHNPAGELKWSYKNLGPFTAPPDEDPELQWGYKSVGPFAAEKRGGGAYSVLLAVNFLCSYQHPTTTTVLSFTAKGADGKDLEADFMMFFRNAAFWERQTEWVFGECKTFNRFKQRDMDRMQVIADNFPNSVLVFATLSDDFSDEEKALFIPFVKACSCYGKLDRPRNAVLLLTGAELFSMFGAPSSWETKSGIAKQMADAKHSFHSLLALCEASQSIYLGLGSWSADWQVEFERRREEANGKPDGA